MIIGTISTQEKSNFDMTTVPPITCVFGHFQDGIILHKNREKRFGGLAHETTARSC